MFVIHPHGNTLICVLNFNIICFVVPV